LNRAAAGAKQREELFKATQREKDRMMEETAAYRLQGNDARFNTTTNAVEVKLAQSTVGLQTKEEFMRKRLELEAGEPAEPAASGEAATSVAAEPEKKAKKKKEKKDKGKLSFQMDDEEGDAEGEAIVKKPRKNPSVVSYAIRKEEPPPAPAAPTKPEPAAPPAPPRRLPTTHGCIKPGSKGGEVDLSMEVQASMSVARTKLTGISPHAVSMVVQATERNNEANNALCLFLKGLLGEGAICEVTRGFKAPVKSVVVRGLTAPSGYSLSDIVYDRLMTSMAA